MKVIVNHQPRLPPTAAADGSGVAAGPTASATSTSTTTTAVAAAASSAATVASHFGETGVDLLLGLGEDVHEVTRLL